MTLKTKLTLVSVLLIVLTVALVGFLGYRQSKWKLKDLGWELLATKTEQAFLLCEHHYRTSPVPSEELLSEIAAVQIGSDGYIAVFSNEPGDRKGTLVIHPSSIGTNIYNDAFPHIQNIIDTIDARGKLNGINDFITYHQGTIAKGRQGEKKVGHYKYFAPWNWVILANSYEKDVFSSRDKLRKTLFQIVLLVMVLGVVTVYVLISQMVKPVQVLTESTREVARGNWDISIAHSSNDEIGALSRAFNKMVESLRDNARMWHEFNVARDMQAQMLPKSPPDIPGLFIDAESIPTKEVGGDFYDFVTLDDGRFGIVVGDVSGHGVSAAMVMTAAMGAVRFAAAEKTQTSDVLNMVNNRLNKDIQNHMFVALFYGIYDPAKRTLHYTNAGQTMPFLLRNGKIQFLPQAENSDRFPLGIVKATYYEELLFQLEQGDKLVMYTDGIVDAMNGSFESYGFDRFSESIKKNAELEASMMIEKLVADMQGHSGVQVHDDITVVILDVT